MQAFFTICFGVGVGFIVIGWVLGEVIGLFDFDMDVDVGGAVSPLKPSVLAAFLTVFGGAGMILLNRVGILQTFLLAGLIGLVIAFLFYRFVIVPLYRAQNTSTVVRQEFIGQKATVAEAIPQGGFGKITYSVNGSLFSSPAKSDDGSGIERGCIVIIVQIENNTYYVRRHDLWTQ